MNDTRCAFKLLGSVAHQCVKPARHDGAHAFENKSVGDFVGNARMQQLDEARIEQNRKDCL